MASVKNSVATIVHSFLAIAFDTSATMKRRYEEYIVAIGNLISLFAFELPICIVDEYQNAWPSRINQCANCQGNFGQ